MRGRGGRERLRGREGKGTEGKRERTEGERERTEGEGERTKDGREKGASERILDGWAYGGRGIAYTLPGEINT